MPNDTKIISAIPCFLIIHIPKIREISNFISSPLNCQLQLFHFFCFLPLFCIIISLDSLP